MNDELHRRLQEAANQIDGATDAVSASEARSRSGSTAAGSRARRPLYAAAAVVALVTLAGIAFLVRDRESATEIGPAETTTSSSSTTTTTTTTTTPATSTSANNELPRGPVPRGPLDLDALPLRGIAVNEPGGVATIYDLEGNMLTTTAKINGEDYPRQLAISGATRALEPLRFPGSLEIPPGCTSSVTSGDFRYAICNDDREIHQVDSNGGVAVLAGTPPSENPPTLGHWRWLIPNHDNTALLAQWSGECEVPVAFVIRFDQPGLTALGQPADAPWFEAPESFGLGWTEDGRVIAEFGPGFCGYGSSEPGVHAVDLDTATTELLIPFDVENWASASFWVMNCNCGNEIEAAVVAAIDSLGYEGCCGVPSHGGPPFVAAGVVHEGEEIPIRASTHEVMLRTTAAGREIGAPDGLIAIVGPDAGGPTATITFSCRDVTVAVDSGRNTSHGVAVAEALAPRMGCTLIEPVLAQQSRSLTNVDDG